MRQFTIKHFANTEVAAEAADIWQHCKLNIYNSIMYAIQLSRKTKTYIQFSTCENNKD